jgi:hypothetical protein
MGEWVDEWMGGWMSGWVDGWMGEASTVNSAEPR